MYKDCKVVFNKPKISVRSTRSLNQVLEYLEKNLKKGYKLEDLKYVLLNQGYMRIEVEEAVRIVGEKIKKLESEKKKKIEEEVSVIEEVVELPKKGFFARLFGR